MDRIVVQAPSGAYNIHFGRDIWQQVQQMARGYDQALVVSDKNVAALYGHRLPFPISPWNLGKGPRALRPSPPWWTTGRSGDWTATAWLSPWAAE